MIFWTPENGWFEVEVDWHLWIVGVQAHPRILYSVYLGPLRITLNAPSWRAMMRDVRR